MNSSPQPGREKEIFEQALELPSSDARLGYVKGACGGDVDLLARVKTLLRAHEATGNFLPEQPGAAADHTMRHTMAESPEKPGSVIGRYKLLQELGEGGCGTVYMAEQEVPVRRRVALKVIKLGMDTKAVIARFEAERQALAMMDHPNIAKVLDAGATETGRPYFVMELVKGLTITKYCDDNNLPTSERLNLFTQVCQAIQHAHQKGIIHRDIKPSNILVTLHDGVPVPKVIDFGIAKATLGRLTDQTVFTAFEQFIGTPAYMSPEQAEMSGLDIDTRSDIYSLGVLLYELLTGRPPFDPQSLVKAGLDEIRRLIREVEPPKPSTRLSTLTSADCTALAKLRGTDAAKLSVLIRGDLDWIVMKALEKNRARRYETAGAFAADIQRHLHNEPVTARPPSATYLLQKLISRNRLAFAATAAIAAALILGLGFSTWAFIQEKAARQRAVAAEQEQAAQRQLADRAREQAEEARANETKQRVLAEAEEKKAKTAAVKSEQAFKFMSRMLQGVGPSVAAGRDTTLLREILDKTAKRLDNDMKDQPEVDEKLRAMLGGVYADLGDFVKAEALAREALAKSTALFDHDHPDVAEAMALLSMTRLMQGQAAESETLARDALAIARKLPADQQEKLPQSLMILGMTLMVQGKLPEAETLFLEAIAYLKQHPDIENLTVDGAQTMLASVFQKQGRLAEAEPMMRESLAAQKIRLGDNHPMVGFSMMGLANVLAMQGKLPEAESTFRDALTLLKKSLGPEHPTIAMLLMNLAMLIQQQGRDRLPEAETLYREALSLQTKVLGKDHPTTNQTSAMLAMVVNQQGRQGEAEKLQEAVAPGQVTGPEKDPLQAADKKTQVAVIAMQQGKFADAESNLREALPVLENAVGSGHQGVIGTRIMLARALLYQFKFAECEAVARDLVAAGRKAFGANSTIVANALLLLADPLQAQGKLDDADTVLREAITISRQQTPGGKSSNVVVGLLRLAMVMQAKGTAAESSRLVTEAAAMARDLTAGEQKNIGSSLDQVVQGLMKAGKTAEAEPAARMLLAYSRQRTGAQSMDVAQALTTHAWVLNKLGRAEEGEVAAHEAVAIRTKQLPAGHWLIAAAEFSVGESLFKQKKYSEAEALLLAVFDNLQKQPPAGSDPLFSFWSGQLKHTAEYLAQVYEATSQPDKAVRWKKLLEGTVPPELEALSTQERQFRQQGKFAEAEVIERKMVEIARGRGGPPGEMLAADMLTRLARNLNSQGKFVEAESLIREAITVREKYAPVGNWATATSRTELGISLAGQKRYAEAEALLLQSYKDIKKQEADIPAKFNVTAQGPAKELVKLYEASNEPAKAVEWKMTADTYTKAEPATEAKP